jgi:peroxiredoxin
MFNEYQHSSKPSTLPASMNNSLTPEISIMKLATIIILILSLHSCSSEQGGGTMGSNSEDGDNEEFYQNGTEKLMNQSDYDKYIIDANLRINEKGFRLMPEIISERQIGDSTIYAVEFHMRTTNNKLIGKQLPDFNFKDLDGNMIKASELKGKPVVINLWFVKCPPCIAEMPALNSIKARYSKTDIQFLSMTFETKSEVKRFLEKRNIDFRIIPDIGKYSDILASNFPQTIFVNREGIITDIQNGMIPIYDKQLKKKSDQMEESEFVNALNVIK